MKLLKPEDLKKTIYLIFAICFCSITSVEAQDLVFSQFYNAPLVINPAFAGNSTSAQFSGNYRLQWPGLPGTYESVALGYNQYFRKIRSGVGFSVISDSSGGGTLQHLTVGGTYMYKIVLKGDYQLKIGIETAVGQNRLDWDRLVFGDQLSTSGPVLVGGSPSEIPPDSFNKAYLDISTGLLIYNKSWFAGMTMKHMNTPDTGFLSVGNEGRLGLPILWNMHVGYQYVFDIGNKQTKPSFVSPSLLIANQADFWQVNAGAYVQLKSLILGAYVRHTLANSDALILAGGVNLDPIKITYSYDLTISGLGANTGGSHEIGILYTLANKRQESKINDCFMLFR